MATMPTTHLANLVRREGDAAVVSMDTNASDSGRTWIRPRVSGYFHLRTSILLAKRVEAMAISITGMSIDDYDAVRALWEQSEGVGLTPSDAQPAVEAYLKRNAGLSLVAREETRIVAAILCGHDGRRGYLYHLAVTPEYRRRGIGRSLVDACLTRLAAEGIHKCTIFVYGRNQSGQEFWRQTGWKDRADLVVLQRELGPR
jgi:ribosomal protein S18 acetylase RimI-like enzyme